jgi:hypothetical protein
MTLNKNAEKNLLLRPQTRMRTPGMLAGISGGFGSTSIQSRLSKPSEDGKLH